MQSKAPRLSASIVAAAPRRASELTNDYRQRRFSHNALQSFKTAESGHIDVEGHNIGMKRGNLGDGFETGFRGANDTEGIVGFHHP